MRRVRNVRHLAAGEIKIAIDVFRFTIPYKDVLVSDALGYDDRPFTMPTSIPTTALFNVSSDDGDYVIHAGDGYYGMSTLQSDKETLIHELTHVWQGVHQGKSYFVVSMINQAGGDAYAYDHDHLKPDFDDYNPEQQASIVEHWFADGKKEYNPETEEGDRRFYYIKAVIRGENVPYNWLRPMVKPLPAGTLAHEWPEQQTARINALVLPLLKLRFSADDINGFTARVKKLEEVFNHLANYDAFVLFKRLQAPKPDDEVARTFFANLSGPTTQRLMAILRSKSGAFL
jgi:hypothetical protein